MRFLPSTDLSSAGNHSSKHSFAADNMVSGNVVYMCAEKWNKCLGIAESLGHRQLSYGMDVST